MRVYDINELQDVVLSANTTPASPTITQTETYVTIATPMSVTFNMVETTNFNPATLDWIIFDFDEAFVLPTTGAGRVTCGGATGSVDC